MEFNAILDELKSYEAGKPIELVVREYGVKPQDVVKLASNENPYGCSPKVQQAVIESVASMALYPDDSSFELKEALATRFGVESENIVIGAGSDQVIEFVIHAKANAQSRVLMNSVTFAMYEIYAKQVGAKIVRTTSLEHDLEQFYTLYKEHNPAIIFICTPNNPTGDAITKEALFDFLDKIDRDTLVVVDGAYMEYTSFKDKSYHIEVAELLSRYENVLYLGTFSKAYGLGGMRVGYGVASKEIIKALHKLRPPFNITTLSLKAAIVALEDEPFIKSSLEGNFEQMERFKSFAKLHKIKYIESFTNFITLCFDEDKNSSEIAHALLKRGMIVRDISSYGLNAIRVTIGTKQQNSRFFELFEPLL